MNKILNIVKLAILLNIINIGWNIKSVNENQIIITKKLNQMTETDYDIRELLNILIDI
jgi:hypothetical protein